MDKSIQSIVGRQLCMSCGVCSAICKHDAIEFCDSFPTVNADKCKNCGLCITICPGKGVDLVNEANNLFPNASKNKLCGKYLNGYVGHSCDDELRYKASSGGLVTQFLVYLLENKKIDGAIVAGYDNNNLKPYTYLAKTWEEIIASKGSKYVVNPACQGLAQLLETENGKYVVVGLPCHIQGIRNLIAKDKRYRGKVIGIFAIYCSVNKLQASAEYYLRHNNVNNKNLKSLEFRTDGCLGNLKITEKDNTSKYVKYESYWHGTHSFFVNERCSMCFDHFGELADISFGDINIPPYNTDKVGINSLVVRSSIWQKELLTAVESKAIALKEVDIDDILKSQSYSKFYKKGVGLQATIRLKKILGSSIPEFSEEKEIRVSFVSFLRAIISLAMRFVGRHRSLWFIIEALDKSKYSKQPQ